MIIIFLLAVAGTERPNAAMAVGCLDKLVPM
jgi:hypothetical protein